MDLAVPHGQLGHLPEGQLPPQLSAKAKPRMRKERMMSFINSQRYLCKEILNE
jgi:hypothetical protein